MDDRNPYTPPLPQNPFTEAVSQDDMQAQVEEAAKRLLREKQDSTTSWQLLATGIIGCFSPILAIYGIIFLLRRPYPFPLKGLAIAGTVLHCLWTALLILMLLGPAILGSAVGP
jgi:hypothetical protein